MNTTWRLGTYLLALLVVFAVTMIIGRLVGPIATPADIGDDGHHTVTSSGQLGHPSGASGAWEVTR